MFPMNLVFQMSDFRYEIKKLRYLIWLKTLTEIRVGPYATNTHNWFLFQRFDLRFSWSWLVDPVDDEDWRDRPRTDPPTSSVSDFWNWLRSYPGPQTSGFQLDFVSRLLVRELRNSARPCVKTPLHPAPCDSQISARSIDRDSLVWVRISVSDIEYRIVSSLVSRLVFTQYEPK
jgi:hypothetical protein